MAFVDVLSGLLLHGSFILPVLIAVFFRPPATCRPPKTLDRRVVLLVLLVLVLFVPTLRALAARATPALAPSVSNVLRCCPDVDVCVSG